MKSREAIERYLEYLTQAVPAAIAEAQLRPNACILAGRLAVEALRAKGIRARPLAVRLQVINPAYADLIERLGGPEHVTEADVRAAESAGAWCVMLGYGPSGAPGGWDGHLVIIADERYLLDLTAGQIQRLHKGIYAEALWGEAPELVRGEGFGFRGPGGAVWLYKPSGDRSFLTKPAWSGYRVAVRDGCVVSERTGSAPEGMMVARVSVPLR